MSASHFSIMGLITFISVFLLSIKGSNEKNNSLNIQYIIASFINSNHLFIPHLKH